MKTHPIIIAAMLLSACCAKEQNPNGATVKADDGTRTRIEVVTPDIIRVSSVPKGARFAKDNSLCVVKKADKPQFSYEKTQQEAIIKTSALTVKVSRADGAVSFLDKDGEVITAEKAKSFSPIEVEGTKAYTVRQTFIDQDEAFYGLGQHQADEWNYKGKNEELFQYNTKISVPFIVSSRGYGILWDSYSFCRWGDPRDYAPINEVFTLYDQNGEEGAITGTYTPKEGEQLVRRESALNQEYLIVPDCERVNGAPEGFKFNDSNVVFEGDLVPAESGNFKFLLYYAGYMKVWMDGELVVPEIWRTAWNPNSHKFDVDLQEGRKAHLRIEWLPDGDVSYCGLRVLSPREPETGWWGEMQDQIDYYLIAGEGETLDGVIAGYRTLTGDAPIMPKWAMGYWQCRERYSTQDQVLETFAEMRRRHIPVDNIVQDWQYWEDDKWGSHEFDATRYPDPKGMVDSIHAMGGRFMISVWPKFYTGTEHFDELDSKGWIYQTAIRDSVEDWLGYQQSFYDAYSEGARKLFWQQMEDHLFPLGVDAWWMDASEPNIHDCTDMDYRKAMCGPTALGPSTKYFNAYGLMNAQAIYEGQRGAAPDQRVFLLTRSGFAGLQRYSTASWSGDIGTRWEDMKTQLSAGLNYAMSGIPYWTQDVGGFSVEKRYMAGAPADLKEWRELNTRWHQMGMFNPLYRSHGQWPYRELWNIAPDGDPTYEAILECGQLRYRLMPYIYSLAARVSFEGYTIMRPLVMDWPSDKAAQECSDEFLFGDAMLIAPVYEYGARSREVYLPEGVWFDWWSGKSYEGGQTITADAPYSHIPVFTRGGQIIPLGEQIEYTAQPQEGSLEICVYEGADATFTLYEDDGLTYAYERGDYATIKLTWDDAAKTLTVGKREGAYANQYPERRITVAVEGRNGISVRTGIYTGEEIVL